jgi:hypothetical protein
VPASVMKSAEISRLTWAKYQVTRNSISSIIVAARVIKTSMSHGSLRAAIAVALLSLTAACHDAAPSQSPTSKMDTYHKSLFLTATEVVSAARSGDRDLAREKCDELDTVKIAMENDPFLTEEIQDKWSKENKALVDDRGRVIVHAISICFELEK